MEICQTGAVGACTYISGDDCSGDSILVASNITHYNNDDFFISTTNTGDSGCSGSITTIYSRGFGLSGAISSRDCSPGWVSGSTYSSGDIVKGSGNWPGSLSNEADGESLCYQANTNPSPGTFETGQWDVIPCSYSKSLDNLKTLFLGDGLRLTDYTEHCSGDSATIVANPRIAISGVDCDDNGVAQASFNQLSFRGGDFFLQPSPIIDFISKYDYTKGDRLNISGKCYVATDDPPIVSSPTSSWLSTYWKEIPCEDSCPIEVCTEGWTISGSTGTPRCTGETDQGS